MTVTAEAPLLQTDTSTLGSLVTEKAVQDLPVNGRNFVRLVQSLPGANEGVPNSLASGTRPDDRRQTSAISINGALDNQNNQLIDGMDNNERAIGTIGVKPSIDAIAEVKVQTSNYTAEAGRTAGGVVNIITKSGTNNFRGSAFEFYRNDRFDSRNFFAQATEARAQSAPVRRQPRRAAAHEPDVLLRRLREASGRRRASPTSSTVPTARMRAGDFSELSAPIYDPLTAPRTPFAGNVIPADRLDPIALRYMALYPAPTPAPAWPTTTPARRNRTQDSSTADVRVDHRFNDNKTLFARYSYNNVDTFTPRRALPTSDGIEPGAAADWQFPGPNTTKAHGVQVNYVRDLQPVADLARSGSATCKADIQSLPLNYGNEPRARRSALPNVNIDDVTSGLALMNLAGYAGARRPDVHPADPDRTTRWQISGIDHEDRGAHNIKIGGG